MTIHGKNENYFTTSEAAEYLSLAEETVRVYVKRNLLKPAKRIGRSHLFTQSECDRYKLFKRPVGQKKEKNS